MRIDELRLSKIIMCARKRKGITQSEVSSITGITQGTLSKIESFQCSASAKHWFLLSKVLDIPSDSVWTGFIDRGIKPTFETQKNVFKLPKRYFNHAYSSVKEIIPIIKYICEKQGQDQFDLFLQRIKVSDLIFVDLNNKINFLFICDLLNHFYGDQLSDDLFKDISKHSKVEEFHGVHYGEYQKKNTSLNLLKIFLENAPFYQDAYKYKITEKSNQSIQFEMEPNEFAMENILKVQNILIPFKKAYLEDFSRIDDRTKLELTLDRSSSNGGVKFTATTMII